MTRTIDDAISVLDPFKQLALSTPKRHGDGSQSSIQSAIGAVFKDASDDRLRTPSASRSSEEYVALHSEFVNAQRARKNKKKNAPRTNYRLEFSRLARLGNLLKNPVAALLHRELDERNKKKQTVEDLDKLAPEEQECTEDELQCMLCFTPEPSRFLIDSGSRPQSRRRRKRCCHQQQLQMTRIGQGGGAVNNGGGTRLSTVRAFCCRAISKWAMLGHLELFGDIESIEQIGERTFKVTFVDLVGACRAVEGHDGNVALVRWFHRRMENQFFRQRRRQSELRVQLLTDYC